MTKFKFVKYKTNKKIRVLFKNPKADIFVVFLHGLKSDLTGKKPNYLMKQCKKRKVGFMGIEYSGHGKSYGKFETGTITSWSNDVKFIIKQKLIKNTEDAVNAGAFGVPTFFLNNQIFWGKEALREMPDYF